MTATLQKTLSSWAKTRKDEIEFDPKNGFYSYDIMVDVYNKAQKDKEALLKKEFEKTYKNNIKQLISCINELVGVTKKNKGELEKLYVKHSIYEADICLTINEDIHNSDTFINAVYEVISDLETKYYTKHFSITINLLDTNENTNYEMLEQDGFDLVADLKE